MEGHPEGVNQPSALRPSVTCVVPVYNGERYLRQAIDSILAQTWAPLDVLIVDDGSTDRSNEIVASYDDRVRCVTLRRGGPAAARNRGVAEAAGDYVAFLDQDDWWPVDKIERQVDRFAARGDLGVSVGHVDSVWDDEAAPRTRDQPRSGAVPGYIPGTMLARRSVFTRVGGFNEQLWYMDGLDWFARAREAGVAVELLPDVLLYHRVHEGNLSRRGYDSRSEALHILRSALGRRRA